MSERSSVRSAGTHSKKKYLKAKELSTSSSTERDGLYKPPAIVPSQVLPSYEDFKLLRTVGRGAFGKVSGTVHVLSLSVATVLCVSYEVFFHIDI